MLPRVIELLVFGLLPFLVGSVAASGAQRPDDDDVVIEEQAPGSTEDKATSIIELPRDGGALR